MRAETVNDPARRTQPQRVEAMRNRLLDATIEVLAATGYGGFSTNEVVRRAGVSRGALAHHFPVKADLIAAAGRRLVALRAEEFRQRFRDIPPSRRTVQRALDALWSFFDDPSFAAMIELTVAARSDAELRAVMAAETRLVGDAAVEVFTEMFPRIAAAPRVATVLHAIVALYTGLGIQAELTGGDDVRVAGVRDLLSASLTAVIPGTLS